MAFPENFVWGAATSAYQIEGAANEEGRGESVWDMFCRQPGRVHEGCTGRTACDHYHRYKHDVSIMHSLGIPAYRFSVSWPRVLPAGTGGVNAPGLAFYDRLVDELLTAGIQPWVTLFHWDFPYALYCRGGWLNRESVEWFSDYAQVVVRALSDRVTHWLTFNEPQCFVGFGHLSGVHAPGVRHGLREALLAAHHVLLAHGRAVQAIRANAVRSPCVGWAPVGAVSAPVDPAEPADVEAARHASFALRPLEGPSDNALFNTTWWADPVVFGRYPEDGLKRFGDAVPDATADDMKTIAQPLDFYGVNIYSSSVIGARAQDGHPVTALKWPVTPQCLYWGPRFLFERYGLPLVITENGMSGIDWVSLDGKVHDPQRIDFIARHLNELRRCIADGVDVRGYFHWSLLDNFEWAEGYKERFGLIHVDFATQKRTLKDSAYWFAEVIKTNGKLPADHVWPRRGNGEDKHVI
jgi:beta-glucosidase